MKQSLENIDKILEYINSVGSDSLSIFGGTFEGGYCLEQCPIEIAKFLLFIKDYPIDNYLEIGSAAIGSARLLTDYFDIKNITIVDLPYHKVLKEREINLNYIKTITNVKNFDGDSKAIEVKQFLKEVDLKYDLIFIDGGHDYETVKNDVGLAVAYVKPNGLICFHDIGMEGDPKAVYDECIKNKNFKHLLTINDKEKGIGILQYVAD